MNNVVSLASYRPQLYQRYIDICEQHGIVRPPAIFVDPQIRSGKVVNGDIHLGPVLLDKLADDVALGVIVHELGHIMLDHQGDTNPAWEKMADKIGAMLAGKKPIERAVIQALENRLHIMREDHRDMRTPRSKIDLTNSDNVAGVEWLRASADELYASGNRNSIRTHGNPRARVQNIRDLDPELPANKVELAEIIASYNARMVDKGR